PAAGGPGRFVGRRVPDVDAGSGQGAGSGTMTMSAASSAAPVKLPVLFQRLRWRLLRHTAEVMLQTSRLRVYLIFAMSLVIWVGVFGVSLAGFSFLHQKQLTLGGAIIGTLFDFLFLALGVLLVFSTGIILYSSLFSSPETAFLLVTPAPADQVF